MEKIKRILKKNLVAVIAIVMIIAGTGSVYGALSAQQEELGSNPTAAENPQKTQVLLEGEGYSLSKQQKSKYDLPQKIEKKDPDKINKYKPPGTRPGAKYPSRPGHKISYDPIILTNLKTQTVKSDSKLTFWVEGKTFMKASIKSNNYTVKMGKTTITGSGSETHCSYTVTVPEGKNTISIKVTDPIRKTSTTKSYVVTGKKEEPKTYKVTATFTADQLYYEEVQGFSYTVSCTCKEGDGPEAIIEAINSKMEEGYSAVWEDSELVSLTVPEEVQLIIESTDPEVEDDVITSNIIDSETFGGAWSTSGMPTKLSEDVTIECVFE